MSSKNKTSSRAGNKNFSVKAKKNKTIDGYQNMDRVDEDTNLIIQGDISVENAKSWVDNGSRL